MVTCIWWQNYATSYDINYDYVNSFLVINILQWWAFSSCQPTFINSTYAFITCRPPQCCASDQLVCFAIDYKTTRLPVVWSCTFIHFLKYLSSYRNVTWISASNKTWWWQDWENRKQQQQQNLLFDFMGNP